MARAGLEKIPTYFNSQAINTISDRCYLPSSQLSYNNYLAAWKEGRNRNSDSLKVC